LFIRESAILLPLGLKFLSDAYTSGDIVEVYPLILDKSLIACFSLNISGSDNSAFISSKVFIWERFDILYLDEHEAREDDLEWAITSSVNYDFLIFCFDSIG